MKVAKIERIRREELRRAREIQQGIAEQFRLHFDHALAVVGFACEPEQGVWLLSPLTGEQ